MPPSAKKRALPDAQAALDEESERGNIKEGAYLRLSKCLKAVHDAETESECWILAKYLLKQVLDQPKSIALMPEFVRTVIVEKPTFLRMLLNAKGRTNPSGAGDEEWSMDLLWALVPFEVHSPEDGDYTRFGVLVDRVMSARGFLLPLERYLDCVETYPSLVGPEPLGRGKTQAVPKLLTIEPAFVWWLLNPGTVDDFYWEDWEVLRLQEYAFTNRHKVYSAEYMPRLVAGLGLRGPDDLEAVAARMRDRGELWPEAKEHVTNGSGDYCGAPMALPARPHDYLWEI